MNNFTKIIAIVALLSAFSFQGQSVWSTSNTGLPTTFVSSDFYISDNTIFALGSNFNGSSFEANIYNSINDGANWSKITTSGLSTLVTGNAIINFNDKLFITGSVSNTTQSYSIFVSTDNGTNWEALKTGLPDVFGINDFDIIDDEIYATGSYFNGSSFEARMYKSSDGSNWTQITAIESTNLLTGNALLSFNDKLFIAGSSSNVSQNYLLFISTDNGDSWTAAETGLPTTFSINDFETIGSTIFVAGSYFNGSSFEARMYQSSDNGESWLQTTSLESTNLFTGNALVSFNNKLFISGSISNSSQNYSVFVNEVSTINSLSNNIEQQNSTLYPNPFKDEVTIYDIDSKKLHIEIYNTQGKSISTYHVLNSSDRIHLNLSDLEKGIYELVMYADDQSSTYYPIKIIKE